MIRTLPAVAALALTTTVASAQTRPARTIRFVVPFTPDGGTDFVKFD